MKIRIYQINMDRDSNRVCFMSYGDLEKLQGSTAIDSSLYDKVYDDDVDCNNLEDVYKMFNIAHPAQYKGRSLSVSDIVECYDNDFIKSEFYFCDDVGFKRIDFKPSQCKESKNFYRGIAEDEEELEI